MRTLLRIAPGTQKAHPEAITLSERYNVPYEEIMERFCQHYGFGEIDLVYSLSAETGTPVDEIFEMRESGMGWGEIKALLQPNTNQRAKSNQGTQTDQSSQRRGD